MTSRRILSHVAVAALSMAGAVGATVLLMKPQSRTAAPAPGAPSPHASPEARGDGGPAGVYISPARQQLIGVRTAAVTTRTLDAAIRATGTVTFDETRVAEVHTRVAGWVDRTDVDFVGKPVTRGAPLFSVYSPDLVSAQREYLLALKARAQLGASQMVDTREGADRLVQAARERLRLWEVTDDQIRELETAGEPRRTVTLFSPFDGIVLERKIVPGQYVTPEMVAYRLADVRSVWVVAQIFESDLSQVAIGDRADVEVAGDDASRRLDGRIAFVYPDIDPATRLARVRIDLPNPDARLKLDAYVSVSLHARARTGLVVPREAVIDTGTRRYVILARGNGYFEPREVKLGPAVGEYSPIVAGLATGDLVVTSAQFLIDSESNLATAMQAMVGMDMSGRR